MMNHDLLIRMLCEIKICEHRVVVPAALLHCTLSVKQLAFFIFCFVLKLTKALPSSFNDDWKLKLLLCPRRLPPDPTQLYLRRLSVGLFKLLKLLIAILPRLPIDALLIY